MLASCDVPLQAAVTITVIAPWTCHAQPLSCCDALAAFHEVKMLTADACTICSLLTGRVCDQTTTGQVPAVLVNWTLTSALAMLLHIPHLSAMS